ncbi:MAG: gamma-glutamyl-gamma-aminobutyrate hydrolase family protein [Chloroflexi bacterium]|nr:gamma-glutamyl-gamma-aminobutyrate hydrolase family protein [Chloroflexota bacterium]
MTTSSLLPRIGVTRSRSDPRDPSIFGNYAACVERAGGQVVWLRPGDGQAPEAILDSLEGLLLTGGADVDPACYGEPLDPRTIISESSRLRDALEVPLAQEALRRDLPVLAICRGVQVLNVALGGSLCQHVEGHQEAEDGSSAFHSVDIASGSRLAQLLGLHGQVILNSRHHQALKNLAPALAVVARSPEGIVEAVESARHSWAFGIQCHPERATEVPGAFQKLFTGLVEAATVPAGRA